MLCKTCEIVKITRWEFPVKKTNLAENSVEFKEVGKDRCPGCGIGGLKLTNDEMETGYKGVVGSENPGETTRNDFYRCRRECEKNIYYEVLSKEIRK